MISASMNASVTDEDVFNKTAQYFGTTRDKLDISSIEKHALATTYQTDTTASFTTAASIMARFPANNPADRDAKQIRSQAHLSALAMSEISLHGTKPDSPKCWGT